MSNFLSSLIGRNQKPQIEIKPRLGSLFEPSPLVGAPPNVPPSFPDETPGQHAQPAGLPAEAASESSTTIASRMSPPETTVSESPIAPQPSPPPQPLSDTGRHMETPQPRPERTDLPAQAAPSRHDRDETARQAQPTVRSRLSPILPVSQEPPVRSTDVTSGDSPKVQDSTRTVQPAPSPPPTPATDRSSRTPDPTDEAQSGSSTAESATPAPPNPDWLARLAATVTSPAAQTRSADVGVRLSPQTGEQEFGAIRPDRRPSREPQPRDQVRPVRAAPQTLASPVQQIPPGPPVIRVTIGRIEVRANVPEPPRPRPSLGQSARRQPALSLSDYLKQRGGRP